MTNAQTHTTKRKRKSTLSLSTLNAQCSMTKSTVRYDNIIRYPV